MYCHHYFIDYPHWWTTAWLSTMGEIITYADQTTSDCIIFDKNLYGDHIYILVPFYTKLDPKKDQKLGVDVAVEQLDMGRSKVTDLMDKKHLNQQCTYIVSAQQLENLKAQGYAPQPLEIFKDINGEQIYYLIELSRKIGSSILIEQLEPIS
ncbi:hypothetical protein PCC8801_3251 [Rippkaea orientalis PCC 8801]|uniref:Uncharacterized protein n=1 Tax=Rippkaea orientalis (strain PCC 8801 / RF-1) TaxID=41431 RepID=B7JYC2_RIPO1|nr:hypothetical protein [Rippkaea orientalis]ACK67224.1 hypothetical protein PCC8801_3251 [Rippkaea orientalis PCC 8801]